MSQEHVEIAKRFVDAFNRRDLNALMDTQPPTSRFPRRWRAPSMTTASRDARG